MQNVHHEIERFKKLYNVENDAELAHLINLGPQTIGTWRNKGYIPSQNKLLLTLLHRDLERRKKDYISNARMFYDECKAVAIAAQNTSGVTPSREAVIIAATKRFEAQQVKWLKDAGKEGQTFTEHRKRQVIAALVNGASAFCAAFVNITSDGSWPPISDQYD